MKKISRREFALLATGGAAMGLARPAAAGGEEPAQAPALGTHYGRSADLPRARGQRVVVVGGGWSGLTVAQYTKKADPALDVVLIEKRSTFVSHPMSNLWLAGLVDLEFLTHSYLDAAANNGYAYLNGAAVDVDRSARRVYTDQGWVAYDHLVLAPGVDYDYSSFGVTDGHDIQTLKNRYPAGFVSGSEHITLRNKLASFTGGIFVLTAPPGIYRCAASPYERACMIAAVIKRKKLKGKVVMIHSREQPAVKPEGFLAAFEELYADQITYMNSTEVKGIDVAGRKIITDFDEISFDDGAIYPRIRAARMIEDLGLVDPESPQKEALIDPFKYNVIGDKRVYVTGDCRPMPFSKSAAVARTEGMYVAKVIAARAAGREAPWQSPRSICYSMVNAAPEEAILIDTTYKFDRTSGQWEYGSTKAVNTRSAALGKEGVAWAQGQYRDMFL